MAGLATANHASVGGVQVMGWKSAKKPPDDTRTVLCICDVGDKEYIGLTGWFLHYSNKWFVFACPKAVVVQWHEIPKGWKRKGKK